MSFDLPPGSLHAIWQTGDFEDWFFIPAGSDDVRMGLVLDTFNGSSLWTDYQSNYAVGYSNLNGDLSRDVGWGSWGCAGTGAKAC